MVLVSAGRGSAPLEPSVWTPGPASALLSQCSHPGAFYTQCRHMCISRTVSLLPPHPGFSCGRSERPLSPTGPQVDSGAPAPGALTAMRRRLSEWRHWVPWRHGHVQELSISLGIGQQGPSVACVTPLRHPPQWPPCPRCFSLLSDPQMHKNVPTFGLWQVTVPLRRTLFPQRVSDQLEPQCPSQLPRAGSPPAWEGDPWSRSLPPRRAQPRLSRESASRPPHSACCLNGFCLAHPEERELWSWVPFAS